MTEMLKCVAINYEEQDEELRWDIEMVLHKYKTYFQAERSIYRHLVNSQCYLRQFL